MFFKVNSKTLQVDQNQGVFLVYLGFLQKSFQGLEFVFSNSRTIPVGTMKATKTVFFVA